MGLGAQEWRRDWQNLVPDLVEEISGRLLSHDVADYLRFRAVCRPWRDLTADPRSSPLDSRFRPRNWIVLTITPAGSHRRRLLNLSTAASLGVDLTALSTHRHVCTADGVLVVLHNETNAICLLDPLSNAVTEFPAISCIVGSEPCPRILSAVSRRLLFHGIKAAAFDDSTYPPTLVLCVMNKIVFAKPGDAHWTLVTPVYEGQARRYPSVRRKLQFCSLLSLGGRCYACSMEGYVYLVELWPLPQLIGIVDDTMLLVNQNTISFLVGGGGGRMLLVRYLEESRCVDVLEADIAERRLLPLRSIGCCAVFVGLIHCVLISTETFPSIAADAVYMGCCNENNERFSVYRINNRMWTEPLHAFSVDEHGGQVPSAGPCSLSQYLVCYVDRAHSFCRPCISHSHANSILY